MKFDHTKKRKLLSSNVKANITIENTFIKSSELERKLTIQEQQDEEDKVSRENSRLASECKEKACILAESGDFISAVRLIKQGLYYDSTDHIIYELLAQLYLQLDKWMDAVLAAEKSIEISPNWSESYLTLARAQRELGELNLAYHNYNKCIELEPNNNIAIIEMNDMKCILNISENFRFQQHQLFLKSNTSDEQEASLCLYNLTSRANQIQITTSKNVHFVEN